MSLLRDMMVLIFLVTLSTCSVIYSQKYALYLGNFLSGVSSVPGPLFRLPLLVKRCAGDEVDYKSIRTGNALVVIIWNMKVMEIKIIHYQLKIILMKLNHI